MEVNSYEFWAAVKNATLFTRAKTWNGGEARFSFRGSGKLLVIASDSFVGIETTVPCENEGQFYQRFLPVAELKRVESGLRELAADKGHVTNLKDWIGDGALYPKEDSFWDDMHYLLGQLGKAPLIDANLEVNPERLSMLSRLEPKGAYPLSLRPFKTDEEDAVWAFRYGPYTKGAIAPLSHELMSDEQRRWLW